MNVQRCAISPHQIHPWACETESRLWSCSEVQQGGSPVIWRSLSTGGPTVASIKHGFCSLKMVATVICKYLTQCKSHGIESARWTTFLGIFFLPYEDGRAALAYKAYKLVQHRNAIREPKIQWRGTRSIGSSAVPALTNAVTGSLCSVSYQNLTSFSLHISPLSWMKTNTPPFPGYFTHEAFCQLLNTEWMSFLCRRNFQCRKSVGGASLTSALETALPSAFWGSRPGVMAACVTCELTSFNF